MRRCSRRPGCRAREGACPAKSSRPARSDRVSSFEHGEHGEHERQSEERGEGTHDEHGRDGCHDAEHGRRGRRVQPYGEPRDHEHDERSADAFTAPVASARADVPDDCAHEGPSAGARCAAERERGERETGRTHAVHQPCHRPCAALQRRQDLIAGVRREEGLQREAVGRARA